MTSLLKCLACGDIREVRHGRNVCSCGRSKASSDDSVVELQGPARILVPADEVTIDGIPWTSIPEEPMLVRRAS
ncbi:MAG: hypothetical protein ACRDHU_13670 [Actinomycetota bacterium]